LLPPVTCKVFWWWCTFGLRELFLAVQDELGDPVKRSTFGAWCAKGWWFVLLEDFSREPKWTEKSAVFGALVEVVPEGIGYA